MLLNLMGICIARACPAPDICTSHEPGIFCDINRELAGGAKLSSDPTITKVSFSIFFSLLHTPGQLTIALCCSRIVLSETFSSDLGRILKSNPSGYNSGRSFVLISDDLYFCRIILSLLLCLPVYPAFRHSHLRR